MKFLNSLLFCCLTSFVYAQTAPLLVIYQAGNQFTAEDFAREIDAHLLKIEDTTKTEIEIAHELRDEIDRLNRESDRHIVIDMSQIADANLDKKIKQFASWVGNDYLIIADQELDEAKLAIAEKGQDTSLTGDALQQYQIYYHHVKKGYL